MSDSDPTASEENSTGKFEVRITNDIRLRCDSMVEHVEYRPIHVDRVTHADGCEFEETDDEEVTGTDTPRRSEPADFGGGESTGVQDL